MTTNAQHSAVRPRVLPAGDAATRAILIVLVALALLRAGTPYLPGMWWWGLNHGRFLPAGVAWTLWALGAVALLPPAGRWLAGLAGWAGDQLADRPLAGYLGWAALGAALAWFIPDQLYHVGDYLMRLGTVLSKTPPERVFPQALGLDISLHYGLINWLTAHGARDANQAERIVGAVEAAGLGGLAVAYARSLNLRGVAADTVATLVLFGGTLALFTGYGKGLREMVLVVTALAVFGVRVARTGRGFLPFALALALGGLLHRSALFLLPAGALVFAWTLRPAALAATGTGHAPNPVAPARWAPFVFLLPLAALAANAPRIWKIVTETDAVHLKPVGADQPGILGALLGPVHLADLFNVLILLAPAALLIPALLAVRAGSFRARPGLLLAALAVPLLGLALFVHPRQGLFRDWDVFGAPAQALTLVAAWQLGEALRDRPARRAWAGTAVAMAAVAATLTWLFLQHEFVSGTTRVRAFATEAPTRPREETMMSWEYLGVRFRGVRQLAQAEQAYLEAVKVAPIARMLYMLALIQSEQGKLREAQLNYRRVTAAAPQLLEGWAGLATGSLQLSDLPEARRALEKVLSLNPGNPRALEMLEKVARAEAAAGPTPSSLDSTTAPVR